MTPRRIAGISLGILLGVSSAARSSAAEYARPGKLLFCASGSLGGLQPLSPPPGYESEFAEAVIEIHGPADIENPAVREFSLVDRAGNVTAFTRVVSIEEFNELYVPGQGSMAYYLRPAHPGGGTQPWNGTLLPGMIHLRIRVSLPRAPHEATRRCVIRFGPYTIEGPPDGMWASG